MFNKAWQGLAVQGLSLELLWRSYSAGAALEELLLWICSREARLEKLLWKSYTGGAVVEELL